MKNRNRRRKMGTSRLVGKQRKLHIEDLEGRRLLAGDFPNDIIVGSGNLARRDAEIDAQINLDEVEREDDPRAERITNNTPATAELIPLGFDPGEFQAIDLRGELIEPTSIGVGINKEIGIPNAQPPVPPVDDGSFQTANPVSFNVGTPIRFVGELGDSTDGFNSNIAAGTGGDGDFYELEDVDEGQILTAHVDNGADSVLVLYNEFGEVLQSSEASPTVENYIQHEAHEAGTYYFAVLPFCNDVTNPACAGVGDFELPVDPNDPSTVQGGPNGSYTITISADAVDTDYYAVDLNPGDILGVNGIGSANVLSLRDPDGELMLQVGDDSSDLYPLASPLPGGGAASFGYVIDTPGRYFVTANGYNYNKYKLEMRVFRPAIESEPVGSKQILFLDFDGAQFNPQVVFGPENLVTLSPLSSYMANFGLRDEADLIDRIVAEVEDDFIHDLKKINPDLAFEVRNSKDHEDPFGQPNVSRVIIGGSQTQLGIQGIFGIADSIDVGNFDTSETAIVLLDTFAGPASDPNSLNHYPIAPGADKAGLVARGISITVSHEAAHFFGIWHTESHSEDNNIIDMGGARPVAERNGIGPDLVWGTADDFDVDFVNDIYSLSEGYTGIENVPGALANLFVPGQGISDTGSGRTFGGIVFNDIDGNGVQDDGEGGVGGSRVYVDVNGDQEWGIAEPSALSSESGAFAIGNVVAGSNAQIRIVVQPDQVLTTAAGLSVVPGGQSANSLAFGIQGGNNGDQSGTDFGDAPASYGDASHQIVPGFSLGTAVDGETGTQEADGADDDGIMLTTLVAGQSMTGTVTASTGSFSPGVLTGWVDFDGDGTFESSERVVSNLLVSGSDSFTFSVPSDSISGTTWARFRYGYDRNSGPTGHSSIGEVEDYPVIITGGTGGTGTGGTTTGPDALNDTFNVSQDAVNVTLNVLANDSAGSGAIGIDSLGTPSQGGTVTVSADGATVLYSPAFGFSGSETFSYTVATAFGTDTAIVNVNVDENGGGGDNGEDLVGFRLETTVGGVPVTNVNIGDTFMLDVYVDDLRTGGVGVFAAYLDVVFDSNLADANGNVVFGSSYPAGQVPTPGIVTATGGELDEFGAFAGITNQLGDGELLLYSVPMTASSDGVLVFSSNVADVSPVHDVLLGDIEDQAVPAGRIDFGTATITIGTPAVSANTNPRNAMDVNNDGVVAPNDALILINDINDRGSRDLSAVSNLISGGYYLDVNNDGSISPGDVLNIVNFLNNNASGEPEIEEAALVGASAATDAAIVDFDLSDDDDDDDFDLLGSIV